MKKLNLILVISAIFSIGILLGQNNIPLAIALSYTDIALGAWSNGSTTFRQGDTYFDTSAGRAEWWISDASVVKVINMRSNSLVTTITIPNGGVTDIKCGLTHCYAWSATTTPFVLWKIGATEADGLYDIVGNLTGSDGNEGGRGIEVIDVVTGGVGSVTIPIPLHNTDCDGLGGGNYVIAFIDGNLVDNDGGTTFNDACTGIIAVGDYMTSMAWSQQLQQVVGDHRNTLAVRLLNAVTQNFKIYNLPTMTLACEANITNGDNWLKVDDGVYWTSNSVGSGTISGFIIATSGSQNCVGDYTIDDTSTVFGISVDSANGRVFVSYADGASSAYVTVRNQSSLASELFRLAMPSTTAITGGLQYYSTQDEIFAESDSGNLVRVYFLSGEQGTDDNATDCFDINPSPLVVQLLCLDDVDNDGIPDAPNSGFVFRAGKNVTAVGNDFFCSLGILADSDSDGVCDNYNVQTNGVGYVITLLLFAFMIAMFAVAKLKTKLQIPEWLWIIGTFAVIGAGIGFKWLDTTLLVIGIIIICGMASFRVYSKFFGGRGSGDD